VTLDFLTSFAKGLPRDWTTAQVVENIIKPLTHMEGGSSTRAGERFVRLTQATINERLDFLPSASRGAPSPVKHVPAVDKSKVGNPTFFISHMWGGSFVEMVNELERHLKDAVASDVYCWVDIFAVNQHDFTEDLKNLQKAIQSAQMGTLVVLGKNAALEPGKPETYGPFSRIWCLFEFLHTLKGKGPDALEFLLPADMTLERFRPAILDLDVTKAKAVKDEDKDRILLDIKENFKGGAEEFNTLLKLQLLLQPLDYSMDLAALWARSAGRATHDWQVGMKPSATDKQAWDLRSFHEWLESEAKQVEGNPLPMFALIGGSGLGKSTFSAALVAEGELNGGSRNVLYHFAKHNDTRRQDQIAVIRSLACQLSCLPSELGRHAASGEPGAWSEEGHCTHVVTDLA